MPRLSALIDVVALFAGRIGGIVVTLFFIPQYAALLGGTVFGAVSVILSLQAFFLVSDLGLATLISRDMAVARGDARAMTATIWLRRRAELLLGVLVFCVVIPAVLVPLVGGAQAAWSIATGAKLAATTALIAVLIGINIVQLGLNAIGRYRTSATTAVVGAIARGGITLLLLTVVPTLAAFLQAQLALAMLHLVVVRLLLDRRAGPVLWRERLFDRPALRDMLRRCVPLTLYTLAAAAAVNLDKPIISAFVSLESAGVYFLATTYALVPVAVLSGPLNSYFAPKVAHAVNSGNPGSEGRLAVIFQLVLMIAVVGPSLSLGLQMDQWMPLWLHQSPAIAAVMEVAPILLAGGALSATGYYPTTYLIAVGDNAYLARLSLACGVAVLVSATIFAAQGRLQALAWSYFAFYAAGFLGLWLRMAAIQGWRNTALFLLRNYLSPLAAIAAGYAAGRLVSAGIALPMMGLLLPILFSIAAGMLVLAPVAIRSLRIPASLPKDFP